jgi:hypothetical protein
MKVIVEEGGFDPLSGWWLFLVDPIGLQNVNEADKLTQEITEWCQERFGEPSIDDDTRWYVSNHRTFTMPNAEQTFEFKMRWVGEH